MMMTKRFELAVLSMAIVDQFCYLGDILSAHGGAEESSIPRTGPVWKKFRELLSPNASKVFLHKAKGKVHSTCTRSVMLHGSKTWPEKESDISRIDRTDTQLVRWLGHVSLSDRKSSEELRFWLGITNITNVLRQARLKWFGQVERIDKKIQSINIALLWLVTREGKETHLKYGSN